LTIHSFCFIFLITYVLPIDYDLADTPWLDGAHVVFGKCIDGTDVIDTIEAVGSQSGKTSKEVRIRDCGEL
jgi:cyclophilin family peptidyl-prolyl cis-trans isomerase